MPKQHFIAMVSDSKLHAIILSGPILEIKGMHAIFQKKGQKGQKSAKHLKTCTKMYKTRKHFEKGQPHAFNYCMLKTAKTCPDYGA